MFQPWTAVTTAEGTMQHLHRRCVIRRWVVHLQPAVADAPGRAAAGVTLQVCSACRWPPCARWGACTPRCLICCHTDPLAPTICPMACQPDLAHMQGARLPTNHVHVLDAPNPVAHHPNRLRATLCGPMGPGLATGTPGLLPACNSSPPCWGTARQSANMCCTTFTCM
jgi:hypothetical protein